MEKKNSQIDQDKCVKFISKVEKRPYFLGLSPHLSAQPAKMIDARVAFFLGFLSVTKERKLSVSKVDSQKQVSFHKTSLGSTQEWHTFSSRNTQELSTLQYLISDLGRLLIFENLPHLVALITFWSLINFKHLVLLVGYYIWSAIKFW